MRAIQPGNVRRFEKSEDAFHEVAARFDGIQGLKVVRKPVTLRTFYREPGETHSLGLQPEEEILHTPSGRRLFFEVKNQGPRGNAEERAFRHHTLPFEQRLRAIYGIDYHPYFTIFTGNLATDDRYILKFRHHIDRDHYFLWKDYNSAEGQDEMERFLERIIKSYLLRTK